MYVGPVVEQEFQYRRRFRQRQRQQQSGCRFASLVRVKTMFEETTYDLRIWLGDGRDPLVADVEQDLKSSGPQRRNSLSYHPMGEGRV